MPRNVHRMYTERPGEILTLARSMLNAGLSNRESLDLVRQGIVIAALERAGGNISRAARMIGTHRNTFARELAQFNLSNLPAEIRRQNKQPQLKFSTDKKTAGRVSTRRRSRARGMKADEIRKRLEAQTIEGQKLAEAMIKGDEESMLAAAIGAIITGGFFLGEIALQLAEMNEAREDLKTAYE
jgi:hypothetical protein